MDLFLSGGERDRLDPLLDSCVALYDQLETEDQIQFKSAAKAFVRTYGFLGSILPYGNAAWEKLSIFLNLLIPKLPSPQTDDLSEGILAAVDLDSYRNEAREAVAIRLEDEDAEIAPVPTGKVGHIVEPEMDPCRTSSRNSMICSGISSGTTLTTYNDSSCRFRPWFPAMRSTATL